MKKKANTVKLERVQGVNYETPPVESSFQQMPTDDLIKVLVANLKKGAITTERAEEIVSAHTGSAVEQVRILTAIWHETPGLLRTASRKKAEEGVSTERSWKDIPLSVKKLIVKKDIDVFGREDVESELRSLLKRHPEEAKKFTSEDIDVSGRGDVESELLSLMNKYPEEYDRWYDLDSIEGVDFERVSSLKASTNPSDEDVLIAAGKEVIKRKGYFQPFEEKPDDFKGADAKPVGSETDKKQQTAQEKAQKKVIKEEYNNREKVQRGEVMKNPMKMLEAWLQGTEEKITPEGSSSHRLDLSGGPVEKKEEKWYKSDASATEKDIKSKDKEKEKAQRASFDVRFVENQKNRMKSAWHIFNKGAEKPVVIAAVGDITEERFPPKDVYEALKSEEYGKEILNWIGKAGIKKTAYYLTGQDDEASQPEEKPEVQPAEAPEEKPVETPSEKPTEQPAEEAPAEEKESSFVITKQLIKNAADEVERRLLAFDVAEVEGEDEVRTKLQDSFDELNSIDNKIEEIGDAKIKASDKLTIRQVAQYAIAAAEETKETADKVLSRIVKDVAKLKQMIGPKEAPEEVETPEAPEKKPPMPEKEGPGMELPEGKASLKKRSQQKSAPGYTDKREEYAVVPATDHMKESHPKKSTDAVVKLMTDHGERAKAMDAVANKAPTGKQGSLKEAVKGDSEELAFYTKLYGRDFASKLVKDYEGMTQNVQGDVQKTRIKRSFETALEMQEKGMLEPTQEARDEQVENFLGMDDNAFNSFQKGINKVSPELKLESGNYKVEVIDGSLKGFIDNIYVANWKNDALPTLNGQLVHSSLKHALEEMRQADLKNMFADTLNAPLKDETPTLDKPLQVGLDEKPTDKSEEKNPFGKLPWSK